MNSRGDFRMRRPVIAVLGATLIGATWGTAGCARRQAPTSAGPRPSVVTNVGAKPSTAEATEFADKLIAAVNSDDVNKFNEVIDWPALLDRAMGGIEIPTAFNQGFKKGVMSSLGDPGGVFEQLATPCKSGGYLKLLRVREVKGRPRPLIRLIMPDHGIAYLDFELARRPDNNVRAIDFYSYGRGEYMSQTVRRVYLPIAADQSRNVLEKRVTQESDVVKAFRKFPELNAAVQKGHSKEALAMYDSLPACAKKEKVFMLWRVHAAQKSNNESLYLAAMEDLAKSFPDDPAIQLLQIDAFYLRKEYDKAMAAIARLDQSVGGDPYLKWLQAELCLEQGKNDEAEKLVQAALDAEPTLHEAHDTRLSIANGQKKYGDMVKFLREYEATFLQPFEAIENSPEFSGFVASAEFKAYKREIPKRP